MTISNFLLATASTPERPATAGTSARGDDAFGAAMKQAIGARSDGASNTAPRHRDSSPARESGAQTATMSKSDPSADVTAADPTQSNAAAPNTASAANTANTAPGNQSAAPQLALDQVAASQVIAATHIIAQPITTPAEVATSAAQSVSSPAAAPVTAAVATTSPPPVFSTGSGVLATAIVGTPSASLPTATPNAQAPHAALTEPGVPATDASAQAASLAGAASATGSTTPSPALMGAVVAATGAAKTPSTAEDSTTMNPVNTSLITGEAAAGSKSGAQKDSPASAPTTATTAHSATATLAGAVPVAIQSVPAPVTAPPTATAPTTTITAVAATITEVASASAPVVRQAAASTFAKVLGDSTVNSAAQSQLAAAPIPLTPPSVTSVAAQAPVAAPAPAAAPLATQLSQPLLALTTAASGEHVLTLSVTPDNLGPVTVRAHVGADGIRVELFAPNDLGRDALRAIMPDLRRDLAGTGMNTNLQLSSNNQPGGNGAGAGANSGLGADQGGGNQQGARAERGATSDSPRVHTPTNETDRQRPVVSGPRSSSIDVMA
jgi:flagellar hook-length control protein FliK